jgi:pimeloyl-ACP methyl ester carboxylesterase
VKRVGRLPVAGADLFYETEGSGIPAVLLHGFSLDTQMWDPQLPALRDVATVIRVDLPGFGRSTMPAPGIAYSHVGDMLRLLDHLGIANAVVAGHSMGGLVPLHLALIAPERVRALVLLDSVLDAVPWDPVSERAMMAPERTAATEGIGAAKRLWLEHLAAPATVVIGAIDVICFHAMADQLSQRIAGALLITVPDAGHMLNPEAVEAANTILREAVADD